MAIRIAAFKDRGWVLEGTTQVLNANRLPLSITSSTETHFTASYKGIDYVFVMSDLRLFLDRSYEYIPYPKYLRLENSKGYLKVGESEDLRIILSYTNGDVAEIDSVDETIEVSSSDASILSVTKNEDKIFVTGLGKGEAVLKVSYGDGVLIRRPYIIISEDESLFPQSHLVGQFPNGIN